MPKADTTIERAQTKPQPRSNGKADPPAELVSQARQIPGLAEALAAFDAVRPFLHQPSPEAPRVTFSTHTND